MAEPTLTRSEFKTEHKLLLGVLNNGAKYPTVASVSTMLTYQSELNKQTKSNDVALDEWANFVKQVTASYLVANHC
jgi:hypothetical protein